MVQKVDDCLRTPEDDDVLAEYRQMDNIACELSRVNDHLRLNDIVYYRMSCRARREPPTVPVVACGEYDLQTGGLSVQEVSDAHDCELANESAPQNTIQQNSRARR